MAEEVVRALAEATVISAPARTALEEASVTRPTTTPVSAWAMRDAVKAKQARRPVRKRGPKAARAEDGRVVFMVRLRNVRRRIMDQ